MAYTLPVGINNTVQLLQYINNDLVEGWFGAGLLLVLGFIIFTRMSVNKEWEEALTVTFLVLTVFSIFFRIWSLVNDYVLVVCVLGFILSLSRLMYFKRTSFR